MKDSRPFGTASKAKEQIINHTPTVGLPNFCEKTSWPQAAKTAFIFEGRRICIGWWFVALCTNSLRRFIKATSILQTHSAPKANSETKNLPCQRNAAFWRPPDIWRGAHFLLQILDFNLSLLRSVHPLTQPPNFFPSVFSLYYFLLFQFHKSLKLQW